MSALADLASFLLLCGLFACVVHLYRRVATLEGHQWQWRFSGGRPEVWDNPAGRWRKPTDDEWRTLKALTGLAPSTAHVSPPPAGGAA